MSHPSTGESKPSLPHPPLWQAELAMLLVGAIFLAVSDQLSFGPSWLVLALGAAAVVITRISRGMGAHHTSRMLFLVLLVGVTGAIAASAAYLISQLTQGNAQAPALLRDSALIWVANVLVFGLWYWEIDGDGPRRRHAGPYRSDDLVFPQLTLDTRDERWRPDFIDYLFLAFNTSTAFSPTDTLVLSRRVKLLMMAQSLISLVVVAVIAARAINTLPSR